MLKPIQYKDRPVAVARSVSSNSLDHKVLLFATAAVLACYFGLSSVAKAEEFSKEIDLWRLGKNDMLRIDRSGPVSHSGDVNGDGLEDVIVAVGVGSVRVVYGPAKGDNGVLNVTSASGATSGFAINGDGPHVSTAGDVNADGVYDIMIGSEGGAYVVLGNSNGFANSFDVATLNGVNGFSMPVNASGVSDAGDINGDGLDDMLIGSAAAGEVYVVYGSTRGFPSVITPESLNGSNGFVIEGTKKNLTGWSVGSAGDFNGDEITDFVIGAPGEDVDGDSEAGRAYIIYGTRNTRPARMNLDSLIVGEGLIFAGSGFERATGKSVTFVGDLNRDGVDDVGIGAPGKGPFGEPSAYPGRVFVLLGSYFGETLVVSQSDLNGANGFSISGVRGGVVPQVEGEKEFGDMAGESIDYAGDINGDGLDDMIIGAHQTIINPQRTGVGSAYLVFGRSSQWPTSMGLSELNGSNGFVLKGTGTTDYTGFSVSRAGDFSGDGIDDVIIGAAGEGLSYLFYGKRTGQSAGQIQNVAAPRGLRAQIYSSTGAEIFWNRSRLPIASYDISRDGNYLTTVDGSKTNYFDRNLTRDETYTYTVTAVAEGGAASAPSEELVVDLSTAGQVVDPVVEDPVVEDPVTVDPGTQEPDTQDPVTQDPVTQDPGTGEPVTVTDPVTPGDTQDPGTTDDPPVNDDDPGTASPDVTTGLNGGSADWLLLLALALPLVRRKRIS